MSTTKQKYLNLLPIAHGHWDRKLFFPWDSIVGSLAIKFTKLLPWYRHTCSLPLGNSSRGGTVKGIWLSRRWWLIHVSPSCQWPQRKMSAIKSRRRSETSLHTRRQMGTMYRGFQVASGGWYYSWLVSSFLQPQGTELRCRLIPRVSRGLSPAKNLVSWAILIVPDF